MIEKYFAVSELSEMLDVPADAVRDFLADNAEFSKDDVDVLLVRLEGKLEQKKKDFC